MGNAYNIFSSKSIKLKIYFDYRLVYKKADATVEKFASFLEKAKHNSIDGNIEEGPLKSLLSFRKSNYQHQPKLLQDQIVYDPAREEFYLNFIVKDSNIVCKSKTIDIKKFKRSRTNRNRLNEAITNFEIDSEPSDLITEIIKIFTMIEVLISTELESQEKLNPNSDKKMHSFKQKLHSLSLASGASTTSDEKHMNNLRIKVPVKNFQLSVDSIIGVKTKREKFSIDYMLMQEDCPVNFLKDNDELEIIVNSYSEMSPSHLSQIGNYEIIKTIGKGGFSMVYLVRCKQTAQIYAMKSMNKSTIKKWQKYDYIMNEKTILSISDHPFIVSFLKHIETENYIHCILDFCIGGELFYHLCKKRRFKEDVAKFYLVEVVLAIEYLHSINVLYRDLKPENILIGHDGHIKLADFGLSIPFFTEHSVSYMFCGSPEYMSPEMLLKVGHNRCLDYYSLGLFLYEMLTGVPPFYDLDRKKIYTAILEEKPRFFKHMSQPAIDLISKLTAKDPKDRLGANKGFEEIKKHEFFKGVEWAKYLKKQIEPPFLPSVRHLNFSSEFTQIPVDDQFSKEHVTSENARRYHTETLKGESQIQIDLNESHQDDISQNRNVVEEEFESWFQNLNKEEDKQQNYEIRQSNATYDEYEIIDLGADEKSRPYIKVSNVENRLIPVSPNSSIDAESADAGQSESDSPGPLNRKSIVPESPYIKAGADEYVKTVNREAYFISVSGSLRNIENVDIDELVSQDENIVSSHRQTLYPNYAYIDEFGQLVEATLEHDTTSKEISVDNLESNSHPVSAAKLPAKLANKARQNRVPVAKINLEKNHSQVYTQSPLDNSKLINAHKAKKSSRQAKKYEKKPRCKLPSSISSKVDPPDDPNPFSVNNSWAVARQNVKQSERVINLNLEDLGQQNSIGFAHNRYHPILPMSAQKSTSATLMPLINIHCNDCKFDVAEISPFKTRNTPVKCVSALKPSSRGGDSSILEEYHPNAPSSLINSMVKHNECRNKSKTIHNTQRPSFADYFRSKHPSIAISPEEKNTKKKILESEARLRSKRNASKSGNSKSDRDVHSKTCLKSKGSSNSKGPNYAKIKSDYATPKKK